jgi:hypothetical protein
MRKSLKSLDNYQLVIPEVMVETLHQLYRDSPFSTTKTGRHDITDILLNVTLNTNIQKSI